MRLSNESHPDEFDSFVAHVEEYLGTPGEFSRYFADPEIQNLRTNKNSSLLLLQALSDTKPTKPVRFLLNDVLQNCNF